ncbi:MAG: hypothetical protein ACK40L_05870 [Hydrogenophaga sp.]
MLAVVCLGISSAPPAWAQVRATSSDQVVFPQGLQWQRMPGFTIDATKSPAVRGSDPSLAQAVERIWADEIAKLRAEASPLLSFVIAARAEVRGQPVHFSVISLLDYERCEPPTNSKDAVNMYDRCLARVAIGPVERAHVVEFRGFCHLNIASDANAPLERNHTQFAFDRSTSTAYFRVLQQGRFVPECNRSVRVEGL